jgi:hypothetical protein
VRTSERWPDQLVNGYTSADLIRHELPALGVADRPGRPSERNAILALAATIPSCWARGSP